MAAVTFTRKAASELRGRFHLALETTSSQGPRGVRLQPDSGGARPRGALAISSASSPAPFTPSARACCASGPSNPASLPASPSWTRCRTWSCATAPGATSSPTRGPPAIRDMLALLETGVRPTDLDSAFATICGNEDVEFPPGDGVCPDPKPAWKALEKFWKKLEKHLPATHRRRARPARSRRRRGSSARSCASRGSSSTGRRDRGSARHVGLRVDDRPEVVGRTRRAEKKRVQGR